MSVKEEVDGSAFRMCTGILLCREEFGRKDGELSYNFLADLLRTTGLSNTCRNLLEFDFQFKKYNLEKDELAPRSEKVHVLTLLQTYKLNHETEDYCSLLLKQISGSLKRNALTLRFFQHLVLF